MGFHENAIYPAKLAVGSTFGWGFATSIIETTTGSEYRTARREVVRHTGDLSTGITDPEDLLTLKRFHMARRGALNGFRFKDPLDHLSNDLDPMDPDTEITPQDQLLQLIEGETRKYQLTKTYSDDSGSGVPYIRKVTKPIAGTVVVSVDNVEQTSGWSVDTATGIVTFTNAPAGQVRAGFEFHTPVRFDAEADRALEVAFREWKYGDIPRIGIMEVLDEGIQDEDAWYGGASSHTITAPMDVTPLNGRVQSFTHNATSSADRYVSLPKTDAVEPGGPIFYIYNEGGNSFAINDAAGNEVVAAPDNTSGSLWSILLAVDASGSGTWLAIQ